MVFSFIQAGCSRGPQYYLDRGNRLYGEGKYADAVLNYRNGIKADARSGEAHYRLGLAQLKQGERREAFDELRSAVNLAPTREDYRVDLADLSLQYYGPDPQKPQILYTQIVETADFLLKRDANSFDGLRFRGAVSVLDGKFEDALATYRKANSIKPLEPPVVGPMVQVLVRLGQTAEAEDLARKCIQNHKDAGAVYDLLANIYVQTKRPAEAEALLKSKIANLPKDPASVLELASFYLDTQKTAAMLETLKILDNAQEFPRGRQFKGEFYAAKGKLDDALLQYRAGLQSDAKNKVGYQKLISKVLIAQGKRTEAIEELNRVVQANSEDWDARLARAILLRQTTDTKELNSAVEELNAILAKSPNDEVARYNLGLANLTQGDPKSARVHFLESARLRRNYLDPRLALAELSQRERKFDEVIRLSAEVQAMDPANSNAKLWHAAGLLGNKSYQQARGELNALLRDSPDSLVINLHMAVLDTAEKKYREAESRYLRFYKPGQQDLRPLEGLVQVYEAQGQPAKSLNLLNQELKQTPDSRPVRLLLGAVATRAGKLDIAMEQYQWLRSSDPNSAVPYASLGDLYQMKGDLASALANYDKARHLAPNDPRIIAAVAYLQTLSGQDKEAIATMRQQLTLDPEDVSALNNLAFTLAENGVDLDQALSMAEKAGRKAPNNPGVADTLGWVYTKKGLNDSATQIYRELVKKYPDQPMFRYHFGVALLQQGKSAEAKTEFTLSLAKNPPKEIADKIKEIVARIN